MALNSNFHQHAQQHFRQAIRILGHSRCQPFDQQQVGRHANVFRANCFNSRMLSSRAVDSQSDTQRRGLWNLTTLGLWLGGGCIGYWLYTMWREHSELWPPAVAPDLRAALYAKHKGDLDLSEQYFRKVLELLWKLPPEELRGEPHLKVTGVAIALADLLENKGQPKAAYEVYSDAFDYLRRAGSVRPLTGPEALRSISIAYRLGELAGELNQTDEEEKWLVSAVEEILKKLGRSAGSQISSPDIKELDPGPPEVLAAIELPEWATATDIASPLESLAEFYERQGKIDYALPLYLHSTSILIPPKSQTQTSAEDKCRGANLMLKISDLLLRGPHNKQTLHQADAWAQKGLVVITETRSKSWRTVPTCEEMLVAAYHGAGYLRELSGDSDGAIKFYDLAIKQAKTLGLNEEAGMIAERLRALKPKN